MLTKDKRLHFSCKYLKILLRTKVQALTLSVAYNSEVSTAYMLVMLAVET
jgi:hypothetical protein